MGAEAKWISPRDLDLRARFDVAAKLVYAKAYLGGHATEFHRSAYQDHVRTFNAFYESREDGPPKVSASDFLNDFHALIDSIRANGFLPEHAIRVDATNAPHDGAHRIAASIALNCDIAIKTDAEPFRASWDHTFFRGRGMHPDYLDHSASGLFELFPKMRAAVLYGASAPFAEQIEEVIGTETPIVFRRRVKLTTIGCDNLIRVLYEGERWLGRREFGYLGARSKAGPCFPQHLPREAVVYWIATTHSDHELVSLKERIRSIVGNGKHSIHITDTTKEARGLGEWLLNPNARHLLNHKKYRVFSGFDREFDSLQRTLSEHEERREDICVVGSGVLSIYGIRAARDLDVLDTAQGQPPKFDTANRHWEQHGFRVDDLVHSPENHFVYQGVKCLSLKRLSELKSKRGEAKDEIDLALINDVLPRNGGLRSHIARAALLVRLYTNAKYLRSYVGHWIARVKNRAQRL